MVTGDTVINELPAIEPFANTFPARMPMNLFAQKIRDLATSFFHGLRTTLRGTSPSVSRRESTSSR